MPNPGFGYRINNARCDRNMSQVELAQALGIRQPTVSRWERETAAPHVRTFETLASILGVSSDWLRWGNDPPQIKTTRKLNRFAEPGTVRFRG